MSTIDDLAQLFKDSEATEDERYILLNEFDDHEFEKDFSPEAKQILSSMRERATTVQSRANPNHDKELRFLGFSKVDRHVDRNIDYCKECAMNTDPRNVPVHPGCKCDAVTDAVEMGVADSEEHPFLNVITRDQANFQDSVFIDLVLPDAIQIDGSTVAILDPEDMRFGDMTRWLEQLGTGLEQAQYVVVAIDEGQEQLDEITDVAELATDLSDRKIWLAIAKAVTPL